MDAIEVWDIEDRSTIISKLNPSMNSSKAIPDPERLINNLLKGTAKTKAVNNSARVMTSAPFHVRTDRRNPLINESMIFISELFTG